jgi:hypothetical protein
MNGEAVDVIEDAARGEASLLALAAEALALSNLLITAAERVGRLHDAFEIAAYEREDAAA